MPANPNPSVAVLRARLAALTQSCPVDQSNPIDCPLYALRHMPEKDRQQWFHALSEDDLQYLADYHHLCSQFRIHAQKPPELVREDRPAPKPSNAG